MRSGPLSDETDCEVWLKYDGANPTGSFKDRGMTLAISKAIEEGAKAVVCASTGNTSAAAAAYAAKAGLTCAVLVPKGKIATGKMAQTLVHGARVLEVEGNFDDALELATDLSERFPVTLVNSVNPYRLQGQKTCAFEIVDALGGPPDLHVVPVGNAGNISSHWIGYSEYLDDGVIAEPPRLMGFQAQGAAPDRASERPCAIRRRSPRRSGSATPLRGTRRSPPPPNPRVRSVPSPIARSSPLTVGPRTKGCSSSRRAPRASPDSCTCTPRAELPRGSTVVCVLTGHGLKDPEWAIAGAAHPAAVPADAAAVAAELGL